MEKLLNWAEEHPYMAGGLTLGVVFLFLWLFGFFGSSSSGSQSGTNLAAAYYNAEAAQTTASTQLQMATVAYTNQTAQAQIQANAAQGIAGTQANMYTTLGQQNAGTTVALSHDNLLATQNSNDDALAAAQTAANYGYLTAQAGYNAANYNTWLSSIIAPLAAKTGGVPTIVSGSGIQGYGTTVVNPPASPAGLEAAGYSPQGAAFALGLPYPGYTA